jgi:hypothetical protein
MSRSALSTVHAAPLSRPLKKVVQRNAMPFGAAIGSHPGGNTRTDARRSFETFFAGIPGKFALVSTLLRNRCRPFLLMHLASRFSFFQLAKSVLSANGAPLPPVDIPPMNVRHVLTLNFHDPNPCAGSDYSTLFPDNGCVHLPLTTVSVWA